MATPIDLIEQEQPNTATTLDDLTTRMAQIVTQNQTQTPSVIYDTIVVPISIKLDELYFMVLNCGDVYLRKRQVGIHKR